jgi:outer membrane protein TolC
MTDQLANGRRPDGSRRAVGNLRALGVAAATLAPMLLTACKVGPEYERPTADVNDAWHAPTGQSAAEVTWWEKFNDPVLTSLVDAAYSQNLTLRIAGLRVIEARAARGIAVGRFFPQLQQAFGTLEADQLSANGPNAGGDRSFSAGSLGLEAAWELDFWGKFRRGIEAADAELLATVADYDAVMISSRRRWPRTTSSFALA